MQSTFSCYIKLVYQDLIFIADIPENMLVVELIERLNQEFPNDVLGMYLYEANHQRVLNPNKTLAANMIKSGAYLFLL